MESHPRLTQTESKARRLDLSSCPGVDTHENLCREQREKVVSADMIMGGVESASKTGFMRCAMKYPERRTL